jgi:hypothetical protein
VRATLVGQQETSNQGARSPDSARWLSSCSSGTGPGVRWCENSSSKNCTNKPMTIGWDVASALAPAFGVKPSSAMAAPMRSRVYREMLRLPDSA